MASEPSVRPSQEASSPQPPRKAKRRGVARGEQLEDRRVLAAPTLGALADVTVQAGAPLHLALDGFDADGQPLTYEVMSDNPDLIPILSSPSNRSWRIDVAGFGVMTFQLFEDLTPAVTQRIIDLTNEHFYDGVQFHRIINNFMSQGGDPTATGTGGSDKGNFDDQFHPDLQHTSKGLLSFAKSQDDTNNSQFFITDVPTRHLDFNHSIFGFLTSGDDVRDAINSTPTQGGGQSNPDRDRPINPVVINSASIFQDLENGVLRLKTKNNGVTGTANVTVRVTDSSGESTSRTFRVTMEPDGSNSQPFLYDFTQPIVISPDRPTVQLPIRVFDAEGNPVQMLILSGDPSQVSLEVDSTTPSMQGQFATANATLRAINNTVGGIFELFVNVQALGGSSNNSDLQRVPIIVTPTAPVLRLVSEDTGSSGDNITRVNTLEFEVTNVLERAELTVYDGDEVVGTFTTGDNGDQEFNQSTTYRFQLPGVVDGDHHYTVTQRFRRAAIVNYRDIVTPVSPASAELEVNVLTQPPSLDAPSGVHLVRPGVPYTVDLASNRENMAGTVYSLTKAPLGMAIDAQTGVIQWTPLPSAFGIENVAVRVTDGAGNTADAQFDLRINRDPSFDPITRPAIGEGAVETFQIQANDPDVAVGDSLTYSFVGSVPEGATLSQSGAFAWTPSEAQGGDTYSFTVRAIDEAGAETSTTFTIRVDETNVAPIFAPVGDQFVTAGMLFVMTFAATDADLPANDLTYSLESGPAGATINAATGEFRFEVPQAAGQLEFPVTVVAEDGQGGRAEASFLLVINVAPVFGPVGDQSASEGDEFSLDAAATDENSNEVLTYALVDGPQGATIDPTTGRIAWLPTETDGGESRSFTVKVTDRGGLEDTLTFNVAVAEVDDPPFFVLPPETLRVNLGETLSLDLGAIDPDIPTSALSYSIDGAPEGASIDPNTGAFTYTPAVGTPPGRVFIHVHAVENDGPVAHAEFEIIVNGAPTLGQIDDLEIDERTPFAMSLDFNDPNLVGGDDELTFALMGAPEGMTIDLATGEINWTPTEEQGEGDYEVTVRVTDLGGLSAERTFAIHVHETANAPELAEIDDHSIAEGQTLAFDLSASDSDPGDPMLVYSLVDGPQGATIDPATGAFAWTPGEADGGATHEITVRVTDAAGLSADRTFSVDVAEVNVAPELPEFPGVKLREGDSFELQVAATDADLPPGTLTYSVSNAPEGMTIDAQTGLLRWTPSSLQGGRTYEVLVQATDAGGLSATRALRLSVDERATAVRIVRPEGIILSAGDTLSLQIEYFDPNGGEAGPAAFTLLDGPEGAVLDPVTGLLNYTVTQDSLVGQIPFTVGVQVGGPDGPTAIETFFVQVGGIELLPALADAYEDLDSFLPGTTPTGPGSTIELLQRGGTPANLGELQAAPTPVAAASAAPNFISFRTQVDNHVNLIHHPRTQNESENVSTGGQGATPASATGQRRDDRAERDEKSAPLGARTSPSNVRPTSQSKSNPPAPLKTADAESARDQAVSEFDRLSDLKPSSNRLSWYTSTNATVPRPVLVWTADRGQVKATNAQLLTNDQVLEVPTTVAQPPREVSVGDAYAKSTPSTENAAHGRAVEEAATETPKRPTARQQAAAAATAAGLFLPMLVHEVRQPREERSGWRRWLGR